MGGCGLLLIDYSLNMIILDRKRPYTRNSLVEKYYIPRGQKNTNETEMACAVREFIEETKFFPKSLVIINECFNLEWVDCDVKYNYLIFIGITQDLKSPSMHITTGDGKLFQTISKEMKCKFSKYENDKISIVSFSEYKQKINSLLDFYQYSNYNQFLNWVDNKIQTIK